MDVNVFEYGDYKALLRNLITKSKIKGIKSKISYAIGCQPAYLSRVLSNLAELSAEQANKIAEYFSFSATDRIYFVYLLLENRAGTSSLKKMYATELSRLRKERTNLELRFQTTSTLSEENNRIYYSRWYYAAIHALVSIQNFQDLDSIYKRLHLPRDVCANAIDFLLETGLIIKKDGKLTSGITSLHLGSKSALIVQHHLNWRLKAMDSIQKNTEELHYSSIITCSRKDKDKINEVLVKAIEHIRSIVRDSQPDEECSCYCIDLFDV